MADEIYLPEIEQKYDFNDNFNACCRTLKKRVREDYDAVVGITGDEGVSKSTLANWIGFKTDEKYSFEKNCLFSPSPKVMVDSIRQLPRFSTINADEAIKILYKQQWWLQVFINKFYRLCRQDNKISIMCMPRFQEFNEGFRNHRILFWIHVLDRGIGVIWEKDWSPFVKDPWHFDDNQKMLDVMTKRRRLHSFDIENKIKIFEKTRGFMGVIMFPDLTTELRIEYKALAAKHKYEGMEEEYQEGRLYQTMKKRWNERLMKAVEFMKKTIPDITQKEIAQRLGIHEADISVGKMLEEY